MRSIIFQNRENLLTFAGFVLADSNKIVSELREYDIDILRLANRRHEYTFESDDAFFAQFPGSLVKHGKVRTNLLLDKSETMLQLQFSIAGTVELICDRTLEPFEHPLEVAEKLILKFGENRETLTDELEIIPRDAQRINVAQFIYEFVGLALPMKKIHPRLRDEKYPETAEGLLVYTSGGESEAEDETDGPAADPRWEALRRLQNDSESE